ncbi:phosphatidylserine decarboxylase [Coniosporium tulheliwenetii]|uniref:Phosphatidylserine decarboxylase n=1 Tax=Coniosporium tulheliwenetii TaxID=3383036 RepID=A0ACC2YR68_9PEZI|nr:phosphatidylserine decarboxylase [Cladosporium sp. JES 115]
MPHRPHFSSRISLPNRLMHHNGASTPGSTQGSRSTSPQPHMGGHRNGNLILKVSVIKGRNLAAKDKGGTSDPYLVISLGDAKEATPAIDKTLNPEWNQTFELPVVGVQSLLLEGVCWDKDRFGKDYMGEFDVPLEDIFANGQPKWYRLKSRKHGKKSSNVSGEVLLQFSIYDPIHTSATPQQILQKLMGVVTTTPSPEEDEDHDLERVDTGASIDTDDDDNESIVGSDTEGITAEKKKKRMRIKHLKKKAKLRTYEFNGSSDVAGVVFLEIVKITDLPPMKNMTRTSFDMDPFVVTSLGKKTYRTRVIRHDLNPVFEEKLVFQVLRHEQRYSLSFTVMDRDKLSGNDFICKADFPVDTIAAMAPEADPNTGLYDLPDPPDPTATPPAAEGLRREASSSSLSSSPGNGGGYDRPPPPTSNPGPTSAPRDSPGTIPAINVDSAPIDQEGLNSYDIPLELKNKEKWEAKHSPTLHIKAKYLPYKALRQQFWRAMLRQYDADDDGRTDKVELTTMLDTLGSTLRESTINSFFDRFADENGGEDYLTFDQAVMCLEEQLEKLEKRSWQSKYSGYNPSTSTSRLSAVGNGDASGSVTPSATSSNGTPINNQSNTSLVPAIELDHLGRDGEEGLDLPDDLGDEKGEEHVVEIHECPICHQPRLNKKSDADIITHIATCASQDWRQVNNIVMAGFVTSSQAQRKWYSKVITKISYGGYKLGANSANILVQDRLTGQINEERMSVYVRLGIRLLYKGLKDNTMERKKTRKLLKSLSIKQGKKYDDPASAAEIEGFINFHQLDMSEVLRDTKDFKSFNEFFYRELKPGARPVSAPDDPRIVTSPADCRTVVFNTMADAQTIWVKGREFSVERLLGNAYPQDAKRYKNGPLGIFRLAPQDYHRFHIPVDGVMNEPKLIEGEYYTVNPMAIRSALDVYGENVRVVVPIDSVAHGRVMVICVGAMMVGSTVITRKAGEHVKRAEELGYFKFGGSTILLLFEPGSMVFDEDLVDNSKGALETLIRVGMSIGHSPDRPPHTPDMRKENPTMEEKQDAKRRIEGSLAPSTLVGPTAAASMT